MKAVLAAILLLAVCPAVALDPAREISQYVSERWSSEQGLPHVSVNGIAQTPDGYLWIATSWGLARFDGVRFHVFDRLTISAEGTWALGAAVIAAKDGGIWLSGPEGQLSRMKDGVFTSVPMSSETPRASITQLLEDRSGDLWALFRDGLFQPERSRGSRKS